MPRHITAIIVDKEGVKHALILLLFPGERLLRAEECGCSRGVCLVAVDTAGVLPARSN